MRAILIAALLLAAHPAAAASFVGSDRSVRAHIADGQVPGVTEESILLDQLGDFVDEREAFVAHDGIDPYSNQARAEQQSGIGGTVVTFLGSAEASGTSAAGGPDSVAEARLLVGISLDVSESFTIGGEYDLELGNGEVSLRVELLGGGVSFLSSSTTDLFESHGTLAYAGTLEPGNYTFAIHLVARAENRALGSNLGGASVELRNLALILEPVNVPEPGTALLVALGLATGAAAPRAARGRRRR
jgi:hypothetical protein